MLINLTPHPIVFPDRIIAPTAPPARCAEVSAPAEEFDGVPLITRAYGEVYDLPDPAPAVMYIVSAMVRMARPERHDLASPGDLVRDAAGAIVGCKNLVINP